MTATHTNGRDPTALDANLTKPIVSTRAANDPPTAASTLVTDVGRTSIANSVVAKIAGRAAREVEGVYQLIGSGAGDAISGLAHRVSGEDAVDRGVSVEVGQREAAVDLKMITVYGASIRDVAQAVRQNIISHMHEMTGLIVKEVNISVTTSPRIAWCPRSGATPGERAAATQGARRIPTRGV